MSSELQRERPGCGQKKLRLKTVDRFSLGSWDCINSGWLIATKHKDSENKASFQRKQISKKNGISLEKLGLVVLEPVSLVDTDHDPVNRWQGGRVDRAHLVWRQQHVELDHAASLGKMNAE